MASLPTSTKCQILKEKPTKEISSSTFAVETRPIEKPTGSQVLLKVKYISNDPAQRSWIQKGADPSRAYAKLPDEGDIMPARAICEVLAVGPEATFKEGQLVVASTGWTQYRVIESKEIRPAPQIPGHSPAIGLGALGLTGLTAHYGLLDVVKTTKEDKCVVVSGAAGATGNMVVQIAKNVLGVEKVIGLAGGKEKCDFVKSLGADVCIDYKSSSWKEELRTATNRQCDVYFDNVGGEILDTMLGYMKRHGRVSVCGAISSYNDMGSGVLLKNYFEVISNRLTLKGFIVLDGLANAEKWIGELSGWMKEGKIKVGDKNETMKSATIDQIPEVWKGLFSGANSGKLVTELKD